MISIQDIFEAKKFLAGKLHRTPLLSAQSLGEMSNPKVSLWLKAENLQKTGSFKPYGIYFKISKLTEEERKRGVLTVSAGNTAQTLAWISAREGLQCTVIVPETAPLAKTAAAEAYGATVLRHGRNHHESWAFAYELLNQNGATLIHPYDDPAVVAGHGVIGLEILEDKPDIQAVLVPVGGGALATGVAFAIKTLRPDVKIIGVEPELAPRMIKALEAGKPIEIPPSSTVADGLRAPIVGAINLEIAQKYIDAVIPVSDNAIINAQMLILERAKLLTEPAGATSVAALLEGVSGLPEHTVAAAILSGGNTDRATLAKHLLMETP